MPPLDWRDDQELGPDFRQLTLSFTYVDEHNCVLRHSSIALAALIATTRALQAVDYA